jgi:hypothetical protein
MHFHYATFLTIATLSTPIIQAVPIPGPNAFPEPLAIKHDLAAVGKLAAIIGTVAGSAAYLGKVIKNEGDLTREKIGDETGKLLKQQDDVDMNGATQGDSDGSAGWDEMRPP